MIDKIMGLIVKSIDCWHNFLGPLCAPAPIVTIFGIVSAIALFFVLRYEYQKWGRMWGGEGVFEFMVSGALGFAITGIFYLLPFALWVGAVCLLVLAVMSILTKLVKISVGEY